MVMQGLETEKSPSSEEDQLYGYGDSLDNAVVCDSKPARTRLTPQKAPTNHGKNCEPIL